jgi:hypothetical protein
MGHLWVVERVVLFPSPANCDRIGPAVLHRFFVFICFFVYFYIPKKKRARG